jgi:TPR repeat protein
MNGSVELATAEEFLTGKRGPRNSAVAATFLWKAVSKENTTAALLLSDLYRTGDGVPKSCDQARLLLYAAARKNVPEAGQKLRALQVGCQ